MAFISLHAISHTDSNVMKLLDTRQATDENAQFGAAFAHGTHSHPRVQITCNARGLTPVVCGPAIVQMGIMVITDVERNDIEFISRTLALKPCAHIDTFTADKLG